MKPIAAVCISCLAANIHAQPTVRGGFVATLGNDTLQVESFTRTSNELEGVVVTRSPATRVMTYRMSFANDGAPARFEMSTVDGNGKTLTTNGSSAVFEWAGDSLVRMTLRSGLMDTLRIATSGNVVFPSPSLPYLGQSFLMYELAFSVARARSGGAAESTVNWLTTTPTQRQPSRSRVWFPASDSADMDYFGVARSGYHFNAAKQLDRADWTGTTYRYRIVRVPSVAVQEIAQRWAAADKRGASVGALSPRDTLRASIVGASILIDYSRPSQRGRTIFGDVVPWDRVWRLGADFATHVVFSDTMKIGDAIVPAGTYTLWMMPRRGGESQLVVNKQTRIFGTNYNPANDLVRITLQQKKATQTERLTLVVEEGALRIRWGTDEYFVPIQRHSPG